MAKWLFKTDPDTYAWKDLAGKGKETWDGVANALALKYLRLVKKGDLIMIYHSGGDKAVIGIAEAVSGGYADPKDPTGKSAVVDVVAKYVLKKPVTLAVIKQNKIFANWELVRMSRLSVMPAAPEHWAEVLRLAK